MRYGSERWFGRSSLPRGVPVRRLTILIGICLLMPACAMPTETFARNETLQIAPFTATCYGMWERSCLQVRERSSEPWRHFYSTIEGFEYTLGFTYELEVAVYRVRNPPADGSSLRYRLVRQLSRVASPPA